MGGGYGNLFTSLLSGLTRTALPEWGEKGLLRLILGTKETESTEHISNIFILSPQFTRAKSPHADVKGREKWGLVMLKTNSTRKKCPDIKVSSLRKQDVLETQQYIYEWGILKRLGYMNHRWEFDLYVTKHVVDVFTGVGIVLSPTQVVKLQPPLTTLTHRLMKPSAQSDIFLLLKIEIHYYLKDFYLYS